MTDNHCWASQQWHPSRPFLANESGHIESESAEHDLHCFQAIRRMDEILLANFMVFHDLVPRGGLRRLDRRRGVGARLLPAREPGPEARRVRVADGLCRLAAYGGRRRPRGFLTADYNAEMIEHIAGHPVCATGRSSSATPTTSFRERSARSCR